MDHKKVEVAPEPSARRSGVFAANGSAADKQQDADEAVRGFDFVLLNNPYLDPSMVQLVTGKPIAVGFASTVFSSVFVGQDLLLPVHL